jgi:chromosome partitioning protein
VKKVGIYNLKGGVGKSTTAVNLACLAAREGDRTLLWDLDPQGAAGYYLGAAGPAKKGSRKLILGSRSLADLAVETRIPNLDVVPARLSYRKIDLRLEQRRKPRSAVKEIIDALPDAYRWVFLDCPAGISLLSESVFQAVDLLLVPLVPTPLSIRAFEEIVFFFQKKDLDRARILPFFSLVERRKRIHRETMEIFRAREERLMRSIIPSLSDIERMAVTRRPVARYRPRSEAGRAFAALWEELRAELSSTPGASSEYMQS